MVAQHPVQPVGVIGVLNFVGVGAGDGAHPVRHQNGSLHHVGAAVKLGGTPPILRQAQHLVHKGLRCFALILHIVDGKQGADGLVGIQTHVEGPEKDGNHGSLPVVGVDDIGIPVEVLQGLQNGLGEEGEALAVVVVAVGVVPVEVVLIVDEVVLQVSLGVLGTEHTTVYTAPGQRHPEVTEKLNVPPGTVFDSLVVGEKDSHLCVFIGTERFGQRRCHVAQPSRF